MIPAFAGDDAATKDRSPYPATMSDMVARFCTSQRRKDLLGNLLDYRAVIASDGYVTGVQLVDGSFLEDVENLRGRPPDDIDVFSFLSAPLKYHGNTQLWQQVGIPFWNARIVDRDANKKLLSLDTYGVVIEELDIGGLIENTIYWYSLFAHQRDTFAWKGFVRIPLNPSDDQVARTLLQQTQVP